MRNFYKFLTLTIMQKKVSELPVVEAGEAE
jgi:hypothetical protein